MGTFVFGSRSHAFHYRVWLSTAGADTATTAALSVGVVEDLADQSARMLDQGAHFEEPIVLADFRLHGLRW